MSGDDVVPPNRREMSKAAVQEVLERASTIDRDRADSLTVGEFREAALEAGMSEVAIEEALAEHFAADPNVDATVSVDAGKRQLYWDVGFALSGGGLGALLARGPDNLVMFALVGVVVAAAVMLGRHAGRNRMEALLQETLSFWAVFVAVMMVFLGLHPSIAILAPLGVGGTTLVGWIMSGIMGSPAQLPEDLDDDRRLIPTPVPDED